MKRLFIGLLADPPLQARIEAHRREWRWPEGASPTREGRYHLTLHWHVREFVLVWSRLWPDVPAARYEVLARCPANDLPALPAGPSVQPGEQLALFA